MDHRQVRTLAESFPPRLMNLHLALRPRHARTSLLCYALHCFASPGAAHTSLALAFNHSRLARLAPCQIDAFLELQCVSAGRTPFLLRILIQYSEYSVFNGRANEREVIESTTMRSDGLHSRCRDC